MFYLSKFNVNLFNIKTSTKEEFKEVEKVKFDTTLEGNITILAKHEKKEGKLVSNSEIKIYQGEKTKISIAGGYFSFENNILNIFID